MSVLLLRHRFLLSLEQGPIGEAGLALIIIHLCYVGISTKVQGFIYQIVTPD